MKQLFTFLLFLIILIIVSCKSTKEFSFNKMYTPPGTIKMGENFFIDQTEITNLNYLEYMHWTERVYGSQSNEYQKTLLDTTVWNELGKYYNSFIDYYLKHPAYRNASVVGISYQQANLFCKWRSDRVMEFSLIIEGVIKHNPSPRQDSCFSIENYFNGKYGKVNSNIFLQYYPEYSLPDSLTYIKALVFADSLKVSLKKSVLKKQSKRNQLEIRCYESIPNKNDTLLYGPDPIRVIRWPNVEIVINLKGNVRELTFDQNRIFGGSFMDSCKTVNEKLFYQNAGPNCYTGFRSICRFKKWEN